MTKPRFLRVYYPTNIPLISHSLDLRRKGFEGFEFAEKDWPKLEPMKSRGTRTIPKLSHFTIGCYQKPYPTKWAYYISLVGWPHQCLLDPADTDKGDLCRQHARRSSIYDIPYQIFRRVAHKRKRRRAITIQRVFKNLPELCKKKYDELPANLSHIVGTKHPCLPISHLGSMIFHHLRTISSSLVFFNQQRIHESELCNE